MNTKSAIYTVVINIYYTEGDRGDASAIVYSMKRHERKVNSTKRGSYLSAFTRHAVYRFFNKLLGTMFTIKHMLLSHGIVLINPFRTKSKDISDYYYRTLALY